MDINVLAINVGNSRIALGAFHGGSLDHVTRIEIEHKDQWPAAIAHAWEAIQAYEGSAVVGASVNPPIQGAIEPIVREICDRKIQWVGSDIDIPIDVMTDEPNKTGIDRILNIAAAFEQMQKACVVVDAGTAITVNCCNEVGDFIGGAIAPGAGLMLRSLHENTASLPEVSFEIPSEVFGKTTESAMRSAVFHGVRGMVKELVEAYAMELGQWPEIIATGGDAPKLFGGWELIHAISPDLTLYGIALAFAEHHIKHGT